MPPNTVQHKHNDERGKNSKQSKEDKNAKLNRKEKENRETVSKFVLRNVQKQDSEREKCIDTSNCYKRSWKTSRKIEIEQEHKNTQGLVQGEK